MLFFRHPLSAVVILLSVSFSAFADSQTLEQEHVAMNQWEFNIALGYAAVQNPLAKRDNAKTYVLPQWSYYGENFYVDNISLGYSLLEDKNYYVDFYTYLNDDGIFFNADDHDLTFLEVRNFVPTREPIIRIEIPKIKRELSYMAGIKAVWDLDWFETKLSFTQDVSAGHDGQELTLSVLDTLSFENINFYYEAGLVYKSEKLVNYYYQFKSDEVLGGKAPNVADNWLANPFIKLAATYRITPNWSAVISVNHNWLHKEIEKTLLVDTREYMTGFIGINYKF